MHDHGQVLEHPHHAWRQGIAARGENPWQLSAQEARALSNGNATLQQERADLIDDAGALTDQSLPHPVQRLQVELLGALGRDAPDVPTADGSGGWRGSTLPKPVASGHA